MRLLPADKHVFSIRLERSWESTSQLTRRPVGEAVEVDSIPVAARMAAAGFRSTLAGAELARRHNNLPEEISETIKQSLCLNANLTT